MGDVMSNRAGRKRKTGERYPSGDLRREDRDMTPEQIILSRHAAAVCQPHRRLVAAEAQHDQRAETALGRYAIDGAISPAQYAAGRRFAGIVARYQAVIEAPQPAPSIAGYMQPGAGCGEVDDRAEWELKVEYDNALQALHGAGATAVWAVKLMTCHEQPCPEGAFRALARGLTRLVEHFRREDEKRRTEVRRIRDITKLYQL